MGRRLLCWWVVSLALAAGFASGIMFAQERQLQRISDTDIGFRVEGVNRDGAPVGTLVVTGKWVATGSAPQASFGTGRDQDGGRATAAQAARVESLIALHAA